MSKPARAESVVIGPLALPGELALPADATGLVVFAHGSGSSRLSPRNTYVARQLHAQGLGTLLFDLLTEGEAAQRANVFDIALLSARVGAALAWLADRAELAALRIGLFGASTGAAAALVAAAEHPQRVAAVVSRGGRPDLAGDYLPRVQAATLLIVGGHDHAVLQLNRDALAALRCEKQLEIVPGATHLFEEPGALESVAALAAHWCARHLAQPNAR
jgi:dienelactone hydrolase